ncbi:hypothetical protein, partial [Janthinobacterium agaricidamnosum]|uniref:hypothetical protein n=1 Tax=Janthinobacterium agaricidamnosum TaxID=55508 RepID=UPI001C3F37CF
TQAMSWCSSIHDDLFIKIQVATAGRHRAAARRCPALPVGAAIAMQHLRWRMPCYSILLFGNILDAIIKQSFDVASHNTRHRKPSPPILPSNHH